MLNVGSVNCSKPVFRAENAEAAKSVSTPVTTNNENDKFVKSEKNETDAKKTSTETNLKIIGSAIIPGLGQAIEGRWKDAGKYFGLAVANGLLTFVSLGLLMPLTVPIGLVIRYFAAKDVYNNAIQNQA